MPNTGKRCPKIDAYINRFSIEKRRILRHIRKLVHETAPDALEVMGYGVPSFKKNRPILYFAAFKNHIGIYPPIENDPQLESDAKPYAGPNGNLKFPIDQEIPWGLIKRVIDCHVKREAALSAKKA